MALILQRNLKQGIIIQNTTDSTQIRVVVNKLKSGRVELHIEAPEKYKIVREEVFNNH